MQGAWSTQFMVDAMLDRGMSADDAEELTSACHRITFCSTSELVLLDKCLSSLKMTPRARAAG